jgi:hypothetical protein
VAAGGGDGDGRDLLVARRDGGADGDAFGAHREAVGGVFDIAAGEDFAGGGEDGGADLEAGVGRIGVGASLARRIA